MSKQVEMTRIGNRVAALVSIIAAVIVFRLGLVAPSSVPHSFMGITLFYLSGMWAAASYFPQDTMKEDNFVLLMMFWPLVGPFAIAIILLKHKGVL